MALANEARLGIVWKTLEESKSKFSSWKYSNSLFCSLLYEKIDDYFIFQFHYLHEFIYFSPHSKTLSLSQLTIYVPLCRLCLSETRYWWFWNESLCWNNRNTIEWNEENFRKISLNSYVFLEFENFVYMEKAIFYITFSHPPLSFFHSSCFLSIFLIFYHVTNII